MKASLHFDLPEEQPELDTALNGATWKLVVSHLNEGLRKKLKYQELSEDVAKELESVRSELWTLVNDYGLSLE